MFCLNLASNNKYTILISLHKIQHSEISALNLTSQYLSNRSNILSKKSIIQRFNLWPMAITPNYLSPITYHLIESIIYSYTTNSLSYTSFSCQPTDTSPHMAWSIAPKPEKSNFNFIDISPEPFELL